MARIAADSFARIIENIAGYPVGMETYFGAGAAHIEVWVPRAGHIVLHLIEVSEDMEDIARLRTVSVVPGDYKPFEVVTDHGQLVLGETRGVQAALSIALDYVAAPAWYAGAQDEHDLVAV